MVLYICLVGRVEPIFILCVVVAINGHTGSTAHPGHTELSGLPP